MAVQGLWNIGGLNLRDYGISEWLGIGPKNTAITSQGALIAPPSPKTIQEAQQLVQSGKKSYGTSGSWAPTVSSGGGGQLSTPSYSTPSAPVDPFAQQRADISSAYDQYIQSLNNMLDTGLPGQKTAQEDIINAQRQIALSDLATQKEQGLQDISTAETKLETQKTKTLRDIASNIRNQMMAGNVYLGTRGVGDSSAAGQMQYALTKLGSRQRGDVMNQVATLQQDLSNKRINLNNIYNSEVNNLQQNYSIQLNQIAQWFSDAQNQIRQNIGQLGISKAKDIQTVSNNAMIFAISMMNNLQNGYRNQLGTLSNWKIQNSATIDNILKQLSQAGQAGNQQINYQPYNFASITPTPAPYWSSNQANVKQDEYGNIILGR